jgi:hypothetical protein
MAAPTKKFTPEIDSALYEELEAVATQNGQSQFSSRHLAFTCITWFRRSTWSVPR